MRLDGDLSCRFEFIIEIGGDVAPSLPTMDRLGQTCGAFRVPLGKCTHKHHPRPPQALFGGRQADPQHVGDGRHRPAHGIVKDDDRPIASRQADEGVLDLVAHLGPSQDLFRIDGVVIVMPAFLDVDNAQLIVMGPRAIDDKVDQDPVDPGTDRGACTELPPPGPGSECGLLGELLGGTLVAGQMERQTGEPGQFGGERGTERISVEALSGWREARPDGAH